MSGAVALRLAAEDPDDLRAISAAVQDAVMRIEDVSFNRRARSLTAVVNRFRWEEPRREERIRAVLRFDGVLAAQGRRRRSGATKGVASLLAVDFAPDAEPPGGVIRLVFAGDDAIALTVECVDATLVDVGPRWRARRPRHDDGGKDGAARGPRAVDS